MFSIHRVRGSHSASGTVEFDAIFSKIQTTQKEEKLFLLFHLQRWTKRKRVYIHLIKTAKCISLDFTPTKVNGWKAAEARRAALSNAKSSCPPRSSREAGGGGRNGESLLVSPSKLFKSVPCLQELSIIFNYQWVLMGKKITLRVTLNTSKWYNQEIQRPYMEMRFLGGWRDVCRTWKPSPFVPGEDVVLQTIGLIQKQKLTGCLW